MRKNSDPLNDNEKLPPIKAYWYDGESLFDDDGEKKFACPSRSTKLGKFTRVKIRQVVISPRDKDEMHVVVYLTCDHYVILNAVLSRARWGWRDEKAFWDEHDKNNVERKASPSW